jgi:hypothetical protein
LRAKRPTNGYTLPSGNPIRVCDFAAETLSGNYPELKFSKSGSYADIDREIDLMRQQIARIKK